MLNCASEMEFSLEAYKQEVFQLPSDPQGELEDVIEEHVDEQLLGLPVPTALRPGTREKVFLLASRLEAGLLLWHPHDDSSKHKLLPHEKFLRSRDDNVRIPLVQTFSFDWVAAAKLIISCGARQASVACGSKLLGHILRDGIPCYTTRVSVSSNPFVVVGEGIVPTQCCEPVNNPWLSLGVVWPTKALRILNSKADGARVPLIKSS